MEEDADIGIAWIYIGLIMAVMIIMTIVASIVG